MPGDSTERLSAVVREAPGKATEFILRAGMRAGPGRGESPRGISPRGARRTVREPLDSYSSHHRATPHSHLPVGKQLRITSRNARYPPRRSPEMVAQLLVFPLGPEGKISV